MKRLLLLSILCLTGCAELAQMQAEEQAQIESNKKQYCANLGAPEGSPNYYDCRLRVEQAIETKEAAKNAAIYESMNRPVGGALRETLAIKPINPIQKNTTNCTSYMIGNRMQTDCY